MGSPWRRRRLIQELLGCGRDVGFSLIRSSSVGVFNVFSGGPVEALLLGLDPGAALLALGHCVEDLLPALFGVLLSGLGATVSLDVPALGARLVVPVLVEVLLVYPHAPERGRLWDIGWLVCGTGLSFRQSHSFGFGPRFAVPGEGMNACSSCRIPPLLVRPP